MSSSSSNGWSVSSLKAWLNGNFKNLYIPSTVKDNITPVKKYSFFASPTKTKNSETEDYVWVPSKLELGLSGDRETKGPTYSEVFTDDASRICKTQSGASTPYWTRTTDWSGTSSYKVVTVAGGQSVSVSSGNEGVRIGFCI